MCSENVGYRYVSAMLHYSKLWSLCLHLMVQALLEASKRVVNLSGEAGSTLKHSKTILVYSADDHAHTRKYAAERGPSKTAYTAELSSLVMA